MFAVEILAPLVVRSTMAHAAALSLGRPGPSAHINPIQNEDTEALVNVRSGLDMQMFFRPCKFAA